MAMGGWRVEDLTGGGGRELHTCSYVGRHGPIYGPMLVCEAVS